MRRNKRCIYWNLIFPPLEFLPDSNCYFSWRSALILRFSQCKKQSENAFVRSVTNVYDRSGKQCRFSRLRKRQAKIVQAKKAARRRKAKNTHHNIVDI